MENQQLSLSGIYFRLAVLHAMKELGVESPHSKEVPPSASAQKIGEQKISRRKKRKEKK